MLNSTMKEDKYNPNKKRKRRRRIPAAIEEKLVELDIRGKIRELSYNPELLSESDKHAVTIIRQNLGIHGRIDLTAIKDIQVIFKRYEKTKKKEC